MSLLLGALGLPIPTEQFKRDAVARTPVAITEHLVCDRTIQVITWRADDGLRAARACRDGRAGWVTAGSGRQHGAAVFAAVERLCYAGSCLLGDGAGLTA
jgi:hypothetical protein